MACRGHVQGEFQAPRRGGRGAWLRLTGFIHSQNDTGQVTLWVWSFHLPCP